MGRATIFLLVPIAAFAVFSCAPDYRDLSTDNGRNAILEQADNLLTAGHCDEAIDILSPLVRSQYNNNDVLMKYSSAYGCKGGVSFTTLVGNLVNTGGQDIWGVLVRTNYSAGASDGKLVALDKAADILRQTATPSGNLLASQRSVDANVFMIFVQANVIATTISPLGNANASTGKRQQAITNSAPVTDQCHVQVAFATINDSLIYASNGSALSRLAAGMSAICSAVPGGQCSTNLDYNTCVNSVAMQLQGQVILSAIGATWQ